MLKKKDLIKKEVNPFFDKYSDTKIYEKSKKIHSGSP